MCELLGLAFNKPISPGLSFRGFRHRAARNEGGWGLAAITPTKARITKEPLRADRSELSQNLRDDPQLIAPIFIGHVRRASCGDVNLQNTHPFTRRIKRSDFVFAHNGTLDMSLLKCRVADPFHVDGSTDSELAMCVLLSWMAREKVDHQNYALFEEDWEADLGEQKALDQKGFIIASQKLTDGEDWQAFRAGSLMVFERGKVVYETIS